MAIRMRRGPKDLFDPNKLLSGEIAVPLDTREIYTAFAPGDVERLATHENVEELIRESTDDIIEDLVEGVEIATEDAEIASEYAIEQGDYARGQGDYAKTQGDFAKEQGESAEDSAESANNAVDNLEELEELVGTQEGIRQDFYEQFKKWDDYSPDTLYKPGNKVLYNGSSYINNVESSGVLPTDSDYWQEIARKGRDGVGSGDMAKEVYDTQNKEQDVFSYTDAAVGDVSSYFEDLVDAVSDRVMDNLASINDLELSKIDKANIVNNGITTEDGTVLDGRYGANLQGQVTTLTNNLDGFKVYRGVLGEVGIDSNTELLPNIPIGLYKIDMIPMTGSVNAFGIYFFRIHSDGAVIHLVSVGESINSPTLKYDDGLRVNLSSSSVTLSVSYVITRFL